MTPVQHRPPSPDIARLCAILAEIGVWLCALRVWLVEVREALGFAMRTERIEARADLRAAAYDIQRALFMMAFRRLPPMTPLRAVDLRGRRPGSAPAGFRRLGEGSALRRVRRVFRSPPALGGSLRQRIARLRDLIDRREIWIARAVAHLLAGPHGARLAPVAPAAARRVSLLGVCAAEGADTS